MYDWLLETAPLTSPSLQEEAGRTEDVQFNEGTLSSTHKYIRWSQEVHRCMRHPSSFMENSQSDEGEAGDRPAG